MYTIEAVQWDKVKLFWQKWKNYDISVKTYGLNIKGGVYFNFDVFILESQKTFGFYKDGVLLGCGQVINFYEEGYRIAGVANMAVDPAYRNNGVGSKLMQTVGLYMNLNNYDFSILYSSLYAKLIGDFYGKFGYRDYKEVMLKSLNQSTFRITPDKLDKIIENIGKF